MFRTDFFERVGRLGFGLRRLYEYRCSLAFFAIHALTAALVIAGSG
jgi:hypothetical protein